MAILMMRQENTSLAHRQRPFLRINYLGCEEFFGLISNAMGGYCFYQNAKLQRLLRYRCNSVPGDVGGRFYYIKEAGEPAWNPGFLPTKASLDRCQCRHGMGYTVFDSEKDGLLGEYGVELLAPCYTEYHLELGEISSPCVYFQTVTGRASGAPGHAKNSWPTGTASWTFMSISQYILGIQPNYGGLKIVPCLPDELPECTVRRTFWGVEYTVHIRRMGERSIEWTDTGQKGIRFRCLCLERKSV